MMFKVLKYMDDDESPLTLRGLLNRHSARSVIGKNGSTHQHIENTYKVKVYLDNESDELGRLCSISGSSTNVARAWREVLSILYPNTSNCTRAVLRFLVPVELIKKLKRVPSKRLKNACVINDIVILSGTSIAINPQPIRNTTEYIFHLSVRISTTYLDQYEHALNLLCALFIKYRKESLSPTNIYYTPNIDKQPQIMLDEDDECNLYIREQQLKKLYGEHKILYQNYPINEITNNRNKYNNNNSNNSVDKNNNYYNKQDYQYNNHNNSNDDYDFNYQQYFKKDYRKKQVTNSSIISSTFHHTSLPISPSSPSSPSTTVTIQQYTDSNSTSSCTSPPFLRKTSSHSTSPLSSASSTPRNSFILASSSSQSRLYSNNRKDRQKDSSTIICEEEVASSDWQSFARRR